MARSINKANLLGNLTRDPDLKYLPKGTPVCNFTVATNRTWKDSSGQEQSEANFHRVVAWGKLAEICGQYLSKGSRAYVEGRISNRSWEDKEGQTRYITEIVANEVIFLDNKGAQQASPEAPPEPPQPKTAPKTESEDTSVPGGDEDVDPKGIPF